MTSKEIKNLLHQKFPSPAFALFTEVAMENGMVSGYVDAVAFGLYPSNGYEIHGIEIKTSRGDFMSEMKNPAKAGAIEYCDRWWLVAPKGVAIKEELPKT